MTTDNPSPFAPKLRFPEFLSGSTWDELTIGDVCDLKAGDFIPASEISEHAHEGSFPCYGGNGFRGYVKSFTHEGGYVLVGRQGALCGNVNLYADKFHATEHALVATPKPGIATGWLFYALDVLKLNRFSIGQAQPGLSVGVLRDVGISVPIGEAEQQKIADCLGSLDDLTAAEGRKLEILRQHKQGLMQRLFPQPGETVPRLRFPEFEDAPDWGEVTLGTLLDRPPDYGVNAAAVPFSEKLPTYIRITDINDDGQFAPRARVSVDIDATDEQYLEDGDIVLARTGASVGKSYRYREEDGPLVYAGFLIRVRPNPERLLSQFIAAYLSTWSYWDWVRLTSARSGQPGINATEYASIRLPLPPAKRTLAEQQKIADCLGSLDDLIAAEGRKLETLRQHKQGLMQQLFPSREAV